MNRGVDLSRFAEYINFYVGSRNVVYRGGMIKSGTTWHPFIRVHNRTWVRYSTSNKNTWRGPAETKPYAITSMAGFETVSHDVVFAWHE